MIRKGGGYICKNCEKLREENYSLKRKIQKLEKDKTDEDAQIIARIDQLSTIILANSLSKPLNVGEYDVRNVSEKQ